MSSQCVFALFRCEKENEENCLWTENENHSSQNSNFKMKLISTWNASEFHLSWKNNFLQKNHLKISECIVKQTVFRNQLLNNILNLNNFKIHSFNMSTSNFEDASIKPICRICFSSQYRLIPSPCSCTGSLGFVHQSCFLRWMLSVQRFDRCEICNQPYHGNAIPRRYEILSWNLKLKTAKCSNLRVSEFPMNIQIHRRIH